ncbi:hypothetical protein A7K93_06640 [Candidatus Methylacidiphilum fumarolicum]|nr:hypothetical protein A7K73_01875 [Candidatus Methylacidiphilum fumarolicum]TFE72669.1 hypothetical protein A7K72_07790 [Candidatus Methylacidiphilum fumarolicum]TFE73136.1 hypothetical protein A7K93_06640 [Candidatus Methylacidiphilum fumarolicum]TFE77535.1 hypothetical protein A7D33_03945 [Candidatus Methylacidiphilum fumarolicum]
MPAVATCGGGFLGFSISRPCLIRLASLEMPVSAGHTDLGRHYLALPNDGKPLFWRYASRIGDGPVP